MTDTTVIPSTPGGGTPPPNFVWTEILSARTDTGKTFQMSIPQGTIYKVLESSWGAQGGTFAVSLIFVPPK